MSDAPFRLYNTLTRSVEAVAPAEPGHLRFYGCGPTVYSYAHIGNFRSFLTADLVLRVARAIGLETTYVTNITDVGHLTEDDFADAGGEDRMARALRSKEGERFPNIYDLARYYTDALVRDWHALNLVEPDVRPRATEHVTQQIDAVARLIDQGHAYQTAKGVYFSVASYPDYGKLSGNRLADELAQGVRDVVQDPEKRDPRDFALWKTDEKHLMQWHSPFGRGFPGWHIECSVMSMEYLGETLDLHLGGEDLIFPHHECEIAQSESLTGKPFAALWVHTRFLQVEGEKMSKSKGNFLTVQRLIAPEQDGGRGVDPLVLRYALLSGKYREPFNFTFKNLRDSAKIVERYRAAAAAVEGALEADAPGDDFIGQRLDAVYDEALAAMLDDLNTPVALAAALKGAKMIQSIDALNGAAARSAQHWLDRINRLFGFLQHEAALPAQAGGDEAADPFAAEVEALITERREARQARDFTRADAIRDRLAEMNVDVMDSPEGTTWRRKPSV